MQILIGEKIRELRRRDGRKQDDLANALGVTCQAVSRWESGVGYPDMEMIPAIANYFGVTIDEMFGYHGDREKRIDELVSEIDHMNFQNNGVNVNIDECITLARNALIEFPGNEKIMLSLASVLYNAGYVRYGEYHLSDEDGYNIFDTKRHRTYAEWNEAISLYEKLLKTMEDGESRHRAVRELTQLYLNIGEYNRALDIVETVPDIYGSREFLKIKASDGKKRAEAYGEALLKIVRACSELIVGDVISYEKNMSPADKTESLRGAVKIFDIVCTDGNYGAHHSFIARIYTFMSLYLWLDGKKEEAFEALDNSLLHFDLWDEWCAKDAGSYTAPLVRLVRYEGCHARANDDSHPHTSKSSLAEDWPWWCVPEYSAVKAEIQSDPRWDVWVKKTQS